MKVEGGGLREQVFRAVELKAISYLRLHKFILLCADVAGDFVDFLIEAEDASLKLVALPQEDNDRIKDEDYEPGVEEILNAFEDHMSAPVCRQVLQLFFRVDVEVPSFPVDVHLNCVVVLSNLAANVDDEVVDGFEGSNHLVSYRLAPLDA